MSEENPAQPKICGYIDIWPNLPLNGQNVSHMISSEPMSLSEGCVRIYVEIPVPLEVFNAAAACAGTARVRHVTDEPPKNILT